MGEHHQLGVMTEINVCEEKTELEDLVVGAANIVYNMVEAWRRLVTVQGGGGVYYLWVEYGWHFYWVLMF